MQPEISRRCLSCGASVRSEAMFCPECGQSLSQRSGHSDAPIATEEMLPTNNPEAESKTAGTLIEGESFAAITEQKVKSEPVKAFPPTTNPSKGGLRQPAREKLHRASTAARGALEENVKRVERIRQVSSVVLEEAHYDPSLRFVLVAVVVFVIVAVLLVLSKVMG
jgi:hypothetical protein